MSTVWAARRAADGEKDDGVGVRVPRGMPALPKPALGTEKDPKSAAVAGLRFTSG